MKEACSRVGTTLKLNHTGDMSKRGPPKVPRHDRGRDRLEQHLTCVSRVGVICACCSENIGSDFWSRLTPQITACVKLEE